MNGVSIVLMIVWVLCCICIGISNIFSILGGMSILFFLIPLVAAICILNNTFSKLLLSIILTMSGLIFVNYTYAYFLHNDKNYALLIRLYIVLIPVCCVLVGYGCTISSLINFKQDNIDNDISTALSRFSGYFVAILTIPLLSTVSIIACYNTIHSLDYQVALGSLIIGSLFLLFEIKKIPIETIGFLIKPTFKINVNIAIVKKWIVFCTLIITIFSALNEYEHRGYWVIWSESIILFIIYLLFLYHFCKIFFKPFCLSNQRPNEINLPSIKSKKNIIIVVALSLICFLSIFWGAIKYL